MTIEEIRKAKHALANEVMQLMEKFQNQTGVTVVGCEIHTAKYRELQENIVRTVITAVRIEVEAL